MTDFNKETERRQYYRIDDTAIFSYQILQQDSNGSVKPLPAENSQKLASAFEIMDMFAQLNQQMGVTLGRIGEHSADIASYLKGLDNKIELLTQLLIFKDNQDGMEPRRQINLSAGGLAFGSDEKLKQGTLLSMDLILTTDLLRLHLKGRVIQVSNQVLGDYPYRVSVGFTDITDIEVDQIMKHIMRLQSEQLRARRQG
jgi:hypothetical protein